MPKGKPWTIEEEKQLRELLATFKSLIVIAENLGKTKEAVRQKMMSLGLKKQQHVKTVSCCSHDLKLPAELPSLEEALKILTAALEALKEPGLDQTEVLRLRSLIQGVKIYKDLLADYADYRGIEAELIEVRKKFAELSKKAQDVAA
jgi:hypothetical protein